MPQVDIQIMTCYPPAEERPRAYGYLRVPTDLLDEQICTMEQTVRTCAESHGLHFVDFFFEHDRGARKSLTELEIDLQKTGTRYLVVPSLDHLSPHPRLRDIRIERLHWTLGVEVLSADPRDDAATGPFAPGLKLAA